MTAFVGIGLFPTLPIVSSERGIPICLNFFWVVSFLAFNISCLIFGGGVVAITNASITGDPLSGDIRETAGISDEIVKSGFSPHSSTAVFFPTSGALVVQASATACPGARSPPNRRAR